MAGRALRFLQQYFLVSCSLQDIITRFRRQGLDWSTLPDHVAIQMNDTHPALSVAELMRAVAGPGGPAVERGLDPDGAHAGLHEPHAAARRRWNAGRSSCSRC